MIRRPDPDKARNIHKLPDLSIPDFTDAIAIGIIPNLRIRVPAPISTNRPKRLLWIEQPSWFNGASSFSLGLNVRSRCLKSAYDEAIPTANP